jgi:hypothetical protein
MLLTKSSGSASRASLVRFVRSSALARVADDSRSSAASSRSRLHRLDQALAVQGGADEAGGNLERRDDRGIEFADALPVIEADDADVFAVDEDGHDGRGARLVAGDAHAFDGARRIGQNTTLLPDCKHGAELIGARLVPRVGAVALAMRQAHRSAIR